MKNPAKYFQEESTRKADIFFRPKESGTPETHQRLCLQIQYKSGKDIQFIIGLIERALHMMNSGYRAGEHIFRGEGYAWNMNGD